MCRCAIPLMHGMLFSQRAPYRLLTVLLASLVIATGCNTRGPKNMVSGTVKLDGQNVVGTVVFVGADGKESTPGPITNGLYNIPDPPLGEVTILVKGSPGGSLGAGPDAKPTIPKMKGAKGGSVDLGPAAGTDVNPPAKYGKKETSPLKHTVKGGKETHNIELQR